MESLPETAVGGGVQLLDEALLLVELVADLAHQLLEQILEGDEARGAAVSSTTMEVSFLGLELAQEGVGPLDSGTK